MKKTSKLRHLLAVSVILQVAAIARPALAATTIEKYQFYGDSVTAYWSSTDACSTYYVNLSATTGATKNNSPPAQSAEIYIDIYDTCTGGYAMGYSQANPAWFQLDVRNTRAASLKGNIPMEWTAWDPVNGYNYYSGNAAIDLQWNGDGSPQRGTQVYRYHAADFMSTSRSSGVSATASVSGSITLDGNPCPVGDANANISNNVTGYMTMWRSQGPSPQTGRLRPTGERAGVAKAPLSIPKTIVNSKK